MAIEKQKVGVFAMDAIDSIVKQFEQFEADDDMPDIELGDMMLVAEIKIAPDPDDPEDIYGRSHILSYCTDLRAWVQLGMAHAVQLAAEERP